MVPFVNTITQ